MVGRLIGPRAISTNALAQEMGVSQESLSPWLREARTVEGMLWQAQRVSLLADAVSRLFNLDSALPTRDSGCP